jgi:hypothetical protein
MKSILILIILLPLGAYTQKPGFEFHSSVNHPLSSKEDRTFYGAGIGTNILFRDTCVFNFKTGIEVNYFHTWDESAYGSKMWSRENVHYQYVVLSLPVFARLTFGDRFKLFLEAGAYLGICLDGQSKFSTTSHGMYPGDLSITKPTTNGYNTGLSITPAVSLGLRLPLSKHMDLVLKPEFAFVKNNLQDADLFSDKKKNSPYYGGSQDFNFSYMYVRFCVGIHLK